MVDWGDLEALAEAVYRLAEWGNDDRATPHQLALRLFGPGSVRSVANLTEHAFIGRLGDRVLIAVRKSLSKPYAQHAIGHELGHYIVDREGVTFETSDQLETACDYIGAAIQMRRGPFRARVRSVGLDPRQLAIDFGTTETGAALRVGETEHVPLAVVSPATVRARGPWVWPDESVVRKWAHDPAPGLRKVTLGERGRVALVANDAG